MPEAVVVGLLGWFLLGPEELFRLSKRVGGWLGELRDAGVSKSLRLGAVGLCIAINLCCSPIVALAPPLALCRLRCPNPRWDRRNAHHTITLGAAQLAPTPLARWGTWCPRRTSRRSRPKRGFPA